MKFFMVMVLLFSSSAFAIRGKLTNGRVEKKVPVKHGPIKEPPISVSSGGHPVFGPINNPILSPPIDPRHPKDPIKPADPIAIKDPIKDPGTGISSGGYPALEPIKTPILAPPKYPVKQPTEPIAIKDPGFTQEPAVLPVKEPIKAIIPVEKTQLSAKKRKIVR
jgi:hypothetical protein